MQPRCGVVDKVVETSLSAETSSHHKTTTIQMIQKTDEFTDAVQGEGCGCARCDAMTVTAEAVEIKVAVPEQ